MKRFLSKYSMPETLDINTATSLVYIGLIILTAYRTDYQGALGAFGVEVEQEKHLPFNLKFVRYISSYYHCDKVQIDILNKHTIRIKPDFDEHETNTDLKSPKIFVLKPFKTTKLLKFATKIKT